MPDGFEDWSGRTFAQVDLSNTRWKETMLVNARFSGLIDGLVINDIEVAPLIAAEMDRRFPERKRLRPGNDVGERRAAWEVVEDLWARTKARCAALPEARLHERVDDEWSCAETFRHLVFVTDAWVARNGLGIEDWHPLGVPPSFWPPPDGIDVGASPTWAEVVAAREDRLAFARAHVDTLPIDCLRTVLDEEWHHNWFANRDLDQLSASER